MESHQDPTTSNTDTDNSTPAVTPIPADTESDSNAQHNTFQSALAAARDYILANPYQATGIAIQAGCIVVLGPLGAAVAPLKVIGFGGAGPAASSLAAWIQSSWYGAYIPAGSIFSLCQAVGMKATFASTVIPGLGAVMSLFKGGGWKKEDSRGEGNGDGSDDGSDDGNEKSGNDEAADYQTVEHTVVESGDPKL